MITIQIYVIFWNNKLKLFLFISFFSYFIFNVVTEYAHKDVPNEISVQTIKIWQPQGLLIALPRCTYNLYWASSANEISVQHSVNAISHQNALNTDICTYMYMECEKKKSKRKEKKSDIGNWCNTCWRLMNISIQRNWCFAKANERTNKKKKQQK